MATRNASREFERLPNIVPASERWKGLFMVQNSEGLDWFDAFECALNESASYDAWMLERVFLLYPMRATIQELYRAMIVSPPRAGAERADRIRKLLEMLQNMDRAYADHQTTWKDLDTRLSEDTQRKIESESLDRLREAEVMATRDLSNLRGEISAASVALDRLTPAAVISDNLAARTMNLLPILTAEYALLDADGLVARLEGIEPEKNSATLAALTAARNRLASLRQSTPEPTLENPFGPERETLRQLESAVARLAEAFQDNDFARDEYELADAIIDKIGAASRRISKSEMERGDNVERWLGSGYARDHAETAGG